MRILWMRLIVIDAILRAWIAPLCRIWIHWIATR
jgi:hypothetical protein